MAKQWHRQPKETDKAHEAFVVYRDMGGSRTLSKVARSLGKSKAQMLKFSGKWKWVDRCHAYDSHLDTKRLKAREDEIEKMNRRQIEMAMGLQTKAAEALINVNILKLDQAEIRRWIIDAAKLERLARGEADSHTKIDISVLASVIDTVIKSVTKHVKDPSARAMVVQELRASLIIGPMED